MGIGYDDSVVVYNQYFNGVWETEYYFGTRFDNVRVEFTQEENRRLNDREDASVCLLKIPNDSTLPKPYKDPKTWEKLTTEEMLENFTLDTDGDLFVIVKKESLNLDIQAPTGIIESNASPYKGKFLDYMKREYGYVYLVNSFAVFDAIPYFQVGGL